MLSVRAAFRDARLVALGRAGDFDAEGGMLAEREGERGVEDPGAGGVYSRMGIVCQQGTWTARERESLRGRISEEYKTGKKRTGGRHEAVLLLDATTSRS